MPAAQADDLALNIAEGIRIQFGGGLIYINQGKKFLRAQRDAAIWREFTGHNHLNLARRYGLSVAHVYDILARFREAAPSG